MRLALFALLFLKEQMQTKILIVDDDPVFNLVLREILEEQGYEVRAAGDGKDGYSNYLSFQPDLLPTFRCRAATASS